MNAYLAILKCRFIVLFQYRAALFAGICTQIFWGMIRIMILSAFFAEAVSKQPISLEQTITFIWIAQAFLHILPWFIDKELESQVKKGDVAYELIRPLDLYWLWFCRSFAIRTIPVLLRSLPMVFLALAFFGMSAPVSFSACAVFLVSLVNAFLLSSAITTFVIITLFWTISGEGITRLLPHFVLLLSGLMIPLPLFPDWLQPFLNVQPFRGIIDIPSRIYTGVIIQEDYIYYLTFQLVWCVVFVVAGKWLINRALKHLVIQGG